MLKVFRRGIGREEKVTDLRDTSNKAWKRRTMGGLWKLSTIMKRVGMALVLMLTFATIVWGQTTTYSTGGSGNFTVPYGVTSITVQCWGAGGGGGFGRTVNGAAGGGGGGGGFTISIATVTPGSTIPYTVGGGGAAGKANGTIAVAGGTTTFSSATPVVANGGGLGTGIAVSGNGTGGAGGAGGTYSGGSGANGVSASGGGGGGSSAGTASNGNSGTGVTGGVAVAGGGTGGNGANNTAGTAGTAPGAGGAGGHRNGGNNAGGNGADGQIIIFWTQPVFYYQSGNPALTASWQTVGGYSPNNFTDNYQTFVIQNGKTATTTAVWSISGTNTILQIQNGGTLTENNNITIAAGVTLQIDNGGTLNHNVNALTIFVGTEVLGNTSTVNYGFNGAQTVLGINYGNLTLSNNGAKTLQVGTTTIGGNLTLSGSATATTVVGLAISGNLNIGNGTTFTAAGFNLTVTGTTTVGAGTSGILAISSATGTKIFTGMVTVNAGGQWNNNTSNSPVTFRGGIISSGTFNAGTGVNTFDTNSQGLTGTFSIPSVTATVITLTNNNTLTIGNALAGTGGLTNAATGTLNLNFTGVPGITTLTATVSGNTVSYGYAGTQTVLGTNYSNLTLANSGVKTLAAGTTAIGGNLAINSGVSASLVAGTTITANILMLNGIAQGSGTWGSTTSSATNKNNTYFGATTGVVNVATSSCTAGNWLGTTSTDWNDASNWCGGIPTSATNVIIPSGGNQPIIGAAGGLCNNITINSGATLTISGAFNLTVSGNWTNNGGTFTANAGTVTFNSSTVASIGGSSSTPFYNLTINKGTVATIVTNSSTAFSVGNNLLVSQGNLVLQATDNNYVVTNDLTVSASGTLTHSVSWDTYGRLLNIGGNLAISGIYDYSAATRAHIQMTGTGKTMNTGTSALSIVTLVNDNFSANGTVTINDNFWAMFGTAGSFHTNGQTVTAKAAVLINGGTVYIDGGTLNVTGGLAVGTSGLNGAVNFSAGTLNTDNVTIGDGTRTGTFTQSGGTANITGALLINPSCSYTFSNSPQVNIAGNFTNNGTYTKATETIAFNGTLAQTIGGTTNTTFNNVTISNAAGVSLTSSETIGGTLSLNSGILVVTGNTLTLNGPTIAGTPNNLSTTTASTLVFGGSSVGVTVPSSVILLNNLTINNTNGVTLAGTLASGTLTFTAGVLNTTATNLLTITNTATGSIGGASATSFVNGPMARTLLAGRTANATYFFPVGDGANYRPLSLVNITTGATTPVILVSETATSALNSDETTITDIAPRNWAVSVTSGNFTNAFIQLTESTILGNTIGQAPAQTGTYVSVGGTGGGATITTAATIASFPAYFAIGSNVIKTYYSYQSGDWNSTSTWTIDPSGSLWIGAAVPMVADNVVILNGRTVTINQNTKSCLSLDIRLGGNLDLQTFTGHNFGTVSGQGTLRLSSVTFPAGTYTVFMAAYGGTVEYYNCTGQFVATQTTYNNLTINLNLATDIVYAMNNLTVNGNFTVTKGVFRICDNSGAGSDLRLIIDIKGNVNVSANGSITVGTRKTNNANLPVTIGTGPFTTGLPNSGYEAGAKVPRYYDIYHKFYVGGDFTNYGTIRFFDPAILAAPQPWFTQLTTYSAVSVRFYGATNNSLLCYNTTDFYNVIVEKGTDQTNVFSIDASQPQYFRLFGRNSEGGNTDAPANPELRKALWLKTGTTRLTGSISIPTLSEGGACASGSYNNSDFYVPSNAALLLDGSNVIVLATADTYREVNACYGLIGGSDAAYGVDQNGCSSFSIYGKFQVNDGYFSGRQSGGFIFWSNASGSVIINGGKVDVKQIRAAGAATGFASYVQTGGTINLIGRFKYNTAAIATVNDIRNVATNFAATDGGPLGTTGTFNIDLDANSYIVSGGTVNIYDVCNGTYAFEVNSLAINTNITGGDVNFYTYTGTTFNVNSGAPFYNLSIYQRTGTTGNVTWTGITKAGVTARPNQPLTVVKDLTLNASSILNTSSLDAFIGNNFNIIAGATYTPGTNTTTFNGNSGQVFTNAGTITTGLNNFVLSNASNTNITNNLFVRGNLTINNNCFLNDQGNTISIAGNVTNSGTHTSTGVGAIILNGAGAQTIGGSGTGIFGNFTINKAGGTSTFTANQSVTGNMRLVAGILNIGTYNLALSATSNIYDVAAGTPAPTTFGNTKMITTSGQQSDGGLTKTFNAIGLFLYPIGTGAVYHPGTIAFSQAPATWGDVTVKPIAKAHPFAITGNQILTYYWKVVSNLITGIVSGSVSHTYHFQAADAGGLLNTYVTGVFNPYAWAAGATAQVDKIANNILFPSVNILDGEFTAGIPAAFGAVKVFYSRQSGDWDTNTTWSNVSNTGPAIPLAGPFPTSDDAVIIGDGGSNDHVVTVSANTKVVGGLQISTGSTLDVQTYTGHNFGTLPDLKVAGTGTLRIASGNFPSGDFGNFLGPNGGTVEYYTQTAPSAIGVAFMLPTNYTSSVLTNITNYCNLTLSPATGKNITMPNTDLVVYKNFNTNISGTSVAGIAQLNNQNVTHTLTVNGNLNVNKGNLQYTNGISTAQNIVVNGDVNVATGATFDVANVLAATNTLSIQGNLTNNGTFNMFTNATRICNVTFTGASNKQINGTTAVRTDFNILTVNKGSDRNSILEATVNAFSLNTILPSALTLTNGTFRLSSLLTITLTTTSPFTIPITGCLSANIGTINIGSANNNAGDLMLQGRLEVMNIGVVNIGGVGGATSNNDIEYAAAGNPEIIVSGGALNIDGQIRRNTSNTLGSLWFNQSGGTITIKGNSFDNSRGMFEVTNTGSQFNVSGGNLVIQRAGIVSFADVLITPESSTVTGVLGIGHTLTIGNGTTPVTQVFDLNISAPIWNLTVDGTTNSKTAGLSVNTLSVLNNLTINGSSVFKANELDVNIGGSLINNNPLALQGVDQGGYQGGDLGSTQNTTFTGTSTGAGAIIGTGTNLTNFANLVIGSSSTMPTITLGSNSNLQVNNNLTLTSGTLSDAGNAITVLGDIANSASHNSALAPGGGIILANGSVQLLSGNGTGKFGNITINNASGVNMTCNNLITGQLSLSGGLLYIDDYKLTMDVNSSFSGTFDANHMVESNGVLSDAGVQKLFSGSVTGFVFPIGSNGRYHPATYTLTSPITGSIKVIPVGQAHPVDNAPTTDQLNYYWKVVTTGFSGLTSATQVYQYMPVDVTGNENNYHSALYNNFAWSDYGTSVINTTTHTITINRTDLLPGEYTAGEVANFSNMSPLYSVGSGNWSNGANWSINPSGIPAYGAAPNGNPVFIQSGHKITMDINGAYAYSVNIVGTLDLVTSSFHNLGYIIDTTHVGTGRMMIQATGAGMFLFPGGNYDRFMASLGTTVELYGTTPATMPLKPGNIYKPYQNLDLTGIGVKYISAENLKVLGNLSINDGAKLNNTPFNKSLFILGNWTDKNTVSIGFVPGTGLTSFEGNTAQTLTITNALTESYYDLSINNALGLTLAGSGNVQVSDNLYLNSSAITTNSTNSLTLTNASSSAVVGGSVGSFINGPLRKQISNGSFFTFPVGKSGTPSRYGNVYLSNIVNAGIWQAEYFNGDPTTNVPSLDKNSKLLPISHVSSNEYWRVIGAAAGLGTVQLRWDNNSGYLASSASTRSKIRVVEWNPAGAPTAQWEYRGKILNDGGDFSGTVSTDNNISLAPGVNLHYLTIGDEGLPTATITSPLTASICNDAIASTTVAVALTGTPPWTLSYKLGAVTTILNNIATSPASIMLTSATPGITGAGVFNFNITNVNDLTGTPGTTDYVTTVTVTVKPIPSNTITGKTSVGTGEVVAYTTPSDASIYAWTLSSNGTPLTGSTATYTVTWSGSTPGPYTIGLTKIAANGCQATNSIAITTSTTPTPVITGSQNICAGSTGNVYSTPNVVGHSYNWSILPGGAGTITAGGSTNSCTVTWNTAATGNSISVKESVTATPTTFTNASFLVDIGMQPSSAISYTALASVCIGNTASVTVNSSENNVRYQLRINPGTNDGVFVTGTGANITLTSSAIIANTTYNIYAYTLAPFNCNAQLSNPASTFTINATPNASAGVVTAGTTPQCIGLTTTYTIAGQVLGGGIGGWTSSNTAVATVIASTGVVTAVGAGTCNIVYTVTGGCNGTPTASQSYTVTPTVGTPVFTLGATSTRCQGAGAVTYTATATNNTGLTYNLDATTAAFTGNSIVAGTGAVIFAAGWSGTTVITVSAAGCNGPSTATHTITINPKPTITPAATAVSKCFNAGAQNTTLTYSAVTNAPTNYTITWNVAALAAGLVNVGSTALPVSPITVPIAAGVVAGTYTGTLGVTDGNGCVSIGVTFTVTINPLPTVNIGGAMAAICQGGSSAALGGSFGVGATSAVWTDGGAGGSFTNNGGATPNTATYTAGAVSGTPVTLTLTTAGGSCGTTNANKSITVNPNPTVNVGGAMAAICQGGISAALGGSFGGGATSAVWTDGGAGGSFTNNGGATPNTATYTAGAASGTPVTLTLTTAGGSCGTTNANKSITVNPNPTVNVGGAMAAICQEGTSSALGGSFGGGATSAVWTDGGAGGSFTNNGGATSNTATYTAGAASGTPVTLTLTTVGGSCGTTNVNKSITINPKPTITPAATAVSKCFNAGAQNTTLTYSVVTNAPTNYTIIWNAAAIAAGLVNVVSTALPASPIIVPIAAGVVAGIYTGTLAVTNGNGCVSTGVTFTVTINPFPGAAGIITGTSTISSIQSGVSYSIAAVPNATSYFWNYTGNNVTINNNTSNNVNLDFPFNATSGILTTKGSNACGTGTVSPDYAITVSILPGTPGVISGTAIVCQGFVGATYSVAAISNATGYVWALPIGGNITTGTNTNNITVTYSSSATSGNVTVYGTNASGNGPTSAGYAVTVDPTPVSGPTYRLPNQ